jgi:uncharacterized protein
MKKYSFFICMVLLEHIAFGQKLFYPKTNYADSLTFAKNIPGLASEVIKRYKDNNPEVYFTTLAYMDIAAGQFALVDKTLNKFMPPDITDSSQLAVLEMPARVYSRTMLTLPGSKEEFEATYAQKFREIYSSLNDYMSEAVNYFYDVKPGTKAKLLRETIDQIKTSDSIGLEDAVKLCTGYGKSLAFADFPLGIAKKLLEQIEEAKYITNDSVLIKMPDGGTVSLTVIRKKDVSTPQPVILMYTIYPRWDVYECKDAVTHNYVGVVADTRGKRLSADAVEPFEHDAADAWYIVDWISKQPWCNRKIGMYGGSYVGFTQWAAAKKLHPALKTIVPQVAVGAGIDFPMQNGIFNDFMLQWLHFVTNNKLTDDKERGDRPKWDSLFGNWYKHGYSFRSLDSLDGRPHALFQRWLNHPAYDEYWQKMTPQKQEFSKINIPVLTITGYYDDDQLGAMYYYSQHYKWNKNPDHYLLIGPYDHGGAQGFPHKTLGGYKLDSVANIPIFDILYQWMDYVLKDSIRPPILKDRVNFEVMGKNEWRHVSSPDKMHNDSLTLYLGNLPDGKHYPLLETRPLSLAYVRQTVDMKDRKEMRFKNGDINAFAKVIDSVLNPEKEKLVFVSDPVEMPFAISGALRASIIASINKKDVDVVIDLYEQTPDGKYMALAEDVQRASFSRDRTKRQLLKPDKPETINLDGSFITCRQFQKGSRIIITVGINKNPSWQINYGSGKDVSDETIKDAAEPFVINWYNSSSITLPILK